MSGIEFLLGDVQEDFKSSRKSLKIQQTAKSAYEKSQYEVGFAACSFIVHCYSKM